MKHSQSKDQRLWDLVEQILNDQNASSDQHETARHIADILKTRNSSLLRNLPAISLIPGAAIVTALGAFLGTWLQESTAVDRLTAEQEHAIEISEIQYRQTLAAQLIDVDIEDPDDRELEINRRICFYAQLGAFRLPEYIVGHTISDENFYSAMMIKLHEKHECLTIEGFPESAPLPPRIVQTPQTSAPVSGTIQGDLARLTSNDPTVRRNARTSLAQQGLEMIRPSLDAVISERESYRLNLGVSVALAEMMRENKRHRSQISDLLSAEDLNRLIDFSLSADRTLRIHASEFLFDLGDHRLIEASLSRWSDTADNPNGRYNLALILHGAAPFVPVENATEVRQRIETLIQDSGPLTQERLGQALEALASR